jgi:anhydro-N-acetylmuramic acid kinase
MFRRLKRLGPRAEATTVPTLAGELADVEAACVERLIAREPAIVERAFCAGVDDPGLWRDATTEQRAYVSLCDGARLAESTGLNVLDAFPARDLTVAGQGGPLRVAGYWALIRHPDRARLIVELGSTTRFVWLPAARDAAAIAQASAGDAGPGMLLLNRLHHAISGTRSLSGGAHLAAQGRLRTDLLEAWWAPIAELIAKHPWNPSGMAQRPLADAIVGAVRVGSIGGPDALRTATRLVVQGVVARAQAAPSSGRLPAEILLVGAGRRNGLLRQDLQTGLPELRLLSDDEIAFPLPALEAAAAAVLCHHYIDQTPANIPIITGAQAPRLLGRLTPGSPQNVLRMAREMASQQPVVSLRTAI